jgi:hypothetical protein
MSEQPRQENDEITTDTRPEVLALFMRLDHSTEEAIEEFGQTMNNQDSLRRQVANFAIDLKLTQQERAKALFDIEWQIRD